MPTHKTHTRFLLPLSLKKKDSRRFVRIPGPTAAAAAAEKILGRHVASTAGDQGYQIAAGTSHPRHVFFLEIFLGEIGVARKLPMFFTQNFVIKKLSPPTHKFSGPARSVVRATKQVSRLRALSLRLIGDPLVIAVVAASGLCCTAAWNRYEYKLPSTAGATSGGEVEFKFVTPLWRDHEEFTLAFFLLFRKRFLIWTGRHEISSMCHLYGLENRVIH